MFPFDSPALALASLPGPGPGTDREPGTDRPVESLSGPRNINVDTPIVLTRMVSGAMTAPTDVPPPIAPNRPKTEFVGPRLDRERQASTYMRAVVNDPEFIKIADATSYCLTRRFATRMMTPGS